MSEKIDANWIVHTTEKRYLTAQIGNCNLKKGDLVWKKDFTIYPFNKTPKMGTIIFEIISDPIYYNNICEICSIGNFIQLKINPDQQLRIDLEFQIRTLRRFLDKIAKKKEIKM